MQGSIDFVGDEAMPDGHDFLLVEDCGKARLFYRRSVIAAGDRHAAHVLERSWEAYRRVLGIEDDPPGPRLYAVS